VTTQPRSFQFLMQRLSVAVQRGDTIPRVCWELFRLQSDWTNCFIFRFIVTIVEDISNALHDSFSSIGNNLARLAKNNNKQRNIDIQSYCHKGNNISIYIEPADKNELLKLITKLRKSKSPGSHNI